MRANAALALFEAAAEVGGGSVDWPRLVSGAREVLTPLLRHHHRLPRPFVDAALDLGDPALFDALADNELYLAEHPDLKERLARRGTPGVTQRALRSWDLRLQRLALAAYPPDGPDLGRLIQQQRAGVVGPTGDAVREAWRFGPVKLTVAEHWRALATLSRLEGPDSGFPDSSLHQDVWPHLPLDLEELEAHAAEWEGTRGAIDELRRGFPDHLYMRAELDWAAVAQRHAQIPFGGPAAAALAARPDCPDDFRFTLFLAEPAAVAPAVPRLTEEMALAPLPKKGAAKAAKVVAKRAVADGLDPGLLLERMRPAGAVLETVRLDELAKLVEARLGADPDKWSWVRARLSAFPGTVTELLEAAGTAAWPERTTSARAGFVTLLDHAPAEAHLALLDRMDEQSVADLFTRGAWRPEWLDRAIADPRRVLRVALASRPSLDAASAERLAALDDPEVNGLVFRRTNTPHRLRMRLLAGRPFDPQARAQLFQQTGGWHGTDALDCADQELQRHIIRHVRVRGKAAQLRLLLNLWHRHGPDAVRDLFAAELKPANYRVTPITPPVRKRVEQVLAIAEPGARQAALDELEAEVAAEESPAGQFALLRAERTDHTLLFKDSRLWHWDVIVAEHRREPLPDPILATIAEAREVPEELVEAGRDKLRPWDSEQATEYAAGRPVEEIMAAPREGHYGGWIGKFTAAGVVTWEQLLRHCVPAGLPLDIAGGSASPPEARAALAALLAEVWDGNLEAIVLAAAMVAGFPGPPAELLAVATAAVAA
ncbi:hypothetical protein [Dactylosporangium sp. NPDC049140]|uniref:hypothetical protein n=1 Tax=Dactylosporangium sp. NPDC049140 TaxID=3155647 RepID=UPI0033C9C048